MLTEFEVSDKVFLLGQVGGCLRVVTISRVLRCLRPLSRNAGSRSCCVFKVSVEGPANRIVFLYIVKMRSDQSSGKLCRNWSEDRLPEFDSSDVCFCEQKKLSNSEGWTRQGANEEFSWHWYFPSQGRCEWKRIKRNGNDNRVIA
jgi:hypothetical protein